MKVNSNSFDAFYKTNTQKSSRSKNDRYNHGDNVDRKLARQERAQFRHLKVTIALKDWE